MRKRQLTSVFSDALLKCALEPERNPRPGQSIRRRIQKAADTLMTRAENGDLNAVAIVFDRLEGKAIQPIDITTEARLTVSIGGIRLRDDMQEARDTAIDVTEQGISEEHGEDHAIGDASDVALHAPDERPHTHPTPTPAQHTPDAVTRVPSADSDDTGTPSDPMDVLRARILASLE
jgi:hypothetical protein